MISYFLYFSIQDAQIFRLPYQTRTIRHLILIKFVMIAFPYIVHFLTKSIHIHFGLFTTKRPPTQSRLQCHTGLVEKLLEDITLSTNSVNAVVSKSQNPPPTVCQIPRSILSICHICPSSPLLGVVVEVSNSALHLLLQQIDFLHPS